MKVKFGNAQYTVEGMNVNVSATRFQVNVMKENATMDQIIADALAAETITVIGDDGETVGVYNGYTNLVAATAYDTRVVSIELENADVRGQIDALTIAQAETESRLDQVEESTEELQESQSTQDLAIEDLAEAVSDLTPEEE